MNTFGELYKTVVSNLANKVGSKVIVQDLETELGADHDLLQAIIEGLHNNQYLHGKASNHRGAREYVVAMIKPAILKEFARLSEKPGAGHGSLNIQIITGNNNKTIQGNDNQIDRTDQ